MKPESHASTQWQWLGWVLIPVLILAAFEKGYRSRLSSSPMFWERVGLRAKEKGRLDYLFLGASRVDAALDPKTLTELLGDPVKGPPVVQHVGAGFATLAQHLIGMERIEEIQPGSLKGCTVLFESIMGLGEPVPFGVSEPTSWTGRWIHPERRALVFPYLRPRHIPKAWASSMKFEEKCQLTAYAIASKATCFTNRERLRSGLINRGKEKLGGLLARFGIKAKEAAQQSKLDLKEGGELRRDEAAADLTDLAAKKWAVEFAASKKPLENWGMLEALMEFVHAKGGRVMFFDMPIPSVFRAGYSDPVKKADAERFERVLARHNSKTIAVPFATDDSFFPDHSHLGASHAKAYSTALAEAIKREAR